MSARVEFNATVRETPVRVFADSFDGDPSVGLGIGPEEVWAEVDDNTGTPFELTDEESERLGIEATNLYLESCDDDI